MVGFGWIRLLSEGEVIEWTSTICLASGPSTANAPGTVVV
jgi:hypothetical protein